jgi:hypothetical protein
MQKPKLRHVLPAAIFFTAICLAAGSSAIAAPITSFNVGTFTTDSILPTSNVLYAEGFGDAASVTTANGVTFQPGRTNTSGGGPGTFSGFLGGGGTSGDAGFDTVLNDGTYAIGSIVETVTLNNLTVGTTYNALFLIDDTRPAEAGRAGSIGDGTNYSANQQFAFAGGSPSLGAFYQATFTADSTSEIIYTPNDGVGQVNAVVVSTVPEPTSLCLLTVGAAALFARRQRIAGKVR